MGVIILTCAIIKIFKLKRRIGFISAMICIIAIIQINISEKNYGEVISKIPEEIKLQAVVISDGIDNEYKYTYVVKVIKIENEGTQKDIKLKLDLKVNKLKGNIPKFGDIIEIIGIYEKPREARNYGGFDYRDYLKSKRIYGTIECKNYSIISTNNIKGVNKFIYLVQNNLKDNIMKILDEEQGALCVGILIGDREKISDKTEEDFKKSNLTHLLAVSGSHITYIIVALTSVIGKANRKISNIFTIIFLIFFMGLTEFTASVMRASIMGIITLIASIINRKSDTVNNLGLSSIILLIYNPYFLLDAGFLLSYAGTIGIIFFSDKIKNFIQKIILKEKKNLDDVKGHKRHSKIIEIKKYRIIINKILNSLIDSFSITVAANLLIIPIIAYMFNTISFTFWISNILAAPIMELVTILGFIVYFISIIFPIFAEFLGIILNFLLTVLLKIAELSSMLPGSSMCIKTPSIGFCSTYYLIIFLIFRIKELKQCKKVSNIILKIKRYINKYKLKIIVATILLALSVNCIIRIIPNNLRIYFVDVGQGDCTLIKTIQNKTILIDGGGSEFGNFDVGESILLPYLLDRNINKIDYLMVSHFDSDHVGRII